MWRHDADELARGNHLRLLPEPREMSLVTGHQVVARGVGAFQELVVIGVFRNAERRHGANRLRMIFDELQKLLPQASANC